MPFSSFHDYTPLQSPDAPQPRSSHDDKADALGPGLNNSGLKMDCSNSISSEKKFRAGGPNKNGFYSTQIETDSAQVL